MFIDNLSEKIAFCAYCPNMCKDICTVHSQTKTEPTSPTMRNWILWLILQGKEKFTEQVVKYIYQGCTNCLLCKAWCVRERDIPEIMRAARADIVALGVAPKSVMTVAGNTKRNFNPYEEPHEKRFSKIESKLEKDMAENIYFVGCTTAYYRPEIAISTIKILESADVDFAVLNGEEWCCGLPQYELGLRDVAIEVAKHNSEVIRKSECKRIITTCPGCYYTLKVSYPMWGVPLDTEVVHISEFLHSLIEKKELNFIQEITKNVAFHDPCYLGRYLSVFEAPRRVIKEVPGVKFVEMRWNREKAYCCGAGGGLRITNPEIAITIGRKVVNEALKSEVEILVTACPACKQQFLGAARDQKRRLQVYDITELSCEALKLNSSFR